jgi:hypothetical protein
MRLGEDIWIQKLDMHLTVYPYDIRPFQSQATLWLHNLTSLPVKESFFSIQFTLALILGLVLFAYLKRLNFDRFWALIGLVMLYTAYPILGAHYAPTHTWDDFWGYLFIVFSLLSLLRKQPIISGLCIALAIIAREQNAVFIPVVLLGIWWIRREFGPVRLIASLILPVLIAGAYRISVAEPQDVQRFTFLAKYNFENLKRTVDSFCSIVIAFGYLWVLSISGLFKTVRDRSIPYRRLLIIGFLITLPSTVALTIAASYVRETRILFPPFAIVIPLAIIGIREWADYIERHWTMKQMIIMGSVFVLLSVTGGFFPGNWLHQHFDYDANSNFRGPLTGVYLGGFVAFGIIYLAERIRRRRHHQSPQATDSTSALPDKA